MQTFHKFNPRQLLQKLKYELFFIFQRKLHQRWPSRDRNISCTTGHGLVNQSHRRMMRSICTSELDSQADSCFTQVGHLELDIGSDVKHSVEPVWETTLALWYFSECQNCLNFVASELRGSSSLKVYIVTTVSSTMWWYPSSFRKMVCTKRSILSSQVIWSASHSCQYLVIFLYSTL